MCSGRAIRVNEDVQFAKRTSSGVHLGPLGRRGVVSNMYILDQKNLSVQERSDKNLHLGRAGVENW